MSSEHKELTTLRKSMFKISLSFSFKWTVWQMFFGKCVGMGRRIMGALLHGCIKVAVAQQRPLEGRGACQDSVRAALHEHTEAKGLWKHFILLDAIAHLSKYHFLNY